MKIRKSVFCGLFGALVFASTFVTKFPIVGAGYVNLGDAVIIISGIVLGPFYGIASASLGAVFADFISGYGVYAPMTLVVKGLMALAVGLIAHRIQSKRFLLYGIIGAVVSEIIMVAGYFLLEWLFMGLLIGVTDIIPNVIQGLVCIFASSLCIIFFRKNNKVKEYLVNI